MGKRTGRIPGCENPTSFTAGSQVVSRLPTLLADQHGGRIVPERGARLAAP